MQASLDQEISRRDAEITALRHELENALADSERHAELARVSRITGVGEISAMMAHQIAQPLTAINAYALTSLRSIKSDTPDMTKIAQNLEKLDQQSRRATEMIRHFAQVLRRRQPELCDVYINAKLLDSISLLKAEMSRHGITVQLELAPSLPAVRADPTLIEQVIFHLLRNAVDALRKCRGGAREIAVKTYPAEGGMVEVVIGDNGPGIDAAMVDRVFEAFAAEKPADAGIGLPICRSIVEAHGGHIRLKSNSSQGAVLAFALPAVNGGALGEQSGT